MKLSRTVSYALKAMVALASEAGESPVCCKHLAEVGGMPERFLLQILRTLVTHNLLRSVRGVYGGYCLARDPREITLLEIVEAIDGPFSLHLPDGTPCDTAIGKSLSELSARLREDLDRVKLADLVSSECRVDPGAQRQASETTQTASGTQSQHQMVTA
jgi:Rrf2 family protein